jgi:glutaredoxin-like protein NrdH
MMKITKDSSIYLTRPNYCVPFPKLHESRIKIYKTPNCPKCAMLAAAISGEFEAVDMSTPAALTELRINGIFSLAAPILQVGEEFYTVEDLFEGENLKTEKVIGLVG